MKYYDAQHGFIEAEGVVQEVINAPEFRRLQGIRQTGALYLVFPGANHTRFAHSLGAMQMARNFTKALSHNPNNPAKFTSATKSAVELAGLLHDVGHGPFSHNLEHAFEKEFDKEKVPEGKTIELKERTKYQEHPLFQDLPVEIKRERVFNHEVIGHALIQKSKIWDIMGTSLGKNVVEILESRADPPYLHQIISSGIDADKADYIQRDSQAVGIGFGALDIDQLLDHMRLDDEQSIAFEERALTAVQHFATARYLHYTGIIYHPKINSLEMLVNEAYAALSRRTLDGEPVVPNLDEYLTLIHKSLEREVTKPWSVSFNGFDDSFLVSRFQQAKHRVDDLKQKAGQQDDLTRESLNNMLDAVLQGKPYKLVCQRDSIEDSSGNKSPSEREFEDFWKHVRDTYKQEVQNRKIIRCSPRLDLLKDDLGGLSLYDDHGDVKLFEGHPAVLYSQMNRGEAGQLHFIGRRIHCSSDLEAKLKADWNKFPGIPNRKQKVLEFT